MARRLARAHAVRQHQVALQFGQTVVGDLGRGQLAEAGVDAVDPLVLVHDVLHMGLGCTHGFVGRSRHAQLYTAALDGAQLGQRDLTGTQFQLGR